jgi:hypothetical protein
LVSRNGGIYSYVKAREIRRAWMIFARLGQLADIIHKRTSDRTKVHSRVAAERGYDEIT